MVVFADPIDLALCFKSPAGVPPFAVPCARIRQKRIVITQGVACGFHQFRLESVCLPHGSPEPWLSVCSRRIVGLKRCTVRRTPVVTGPFSMCESQVIDPALGKQFTHLGVRDVLILLPVTLLGKVMLTVWPQERSIAGSPRIRWWELLMSRSRALSASTGLGKSGYQSRGARFEAIIMDALRCRSSTSSTTSSACWGVSGFMQKSSAIRRPGSR